MKNLAARMVIKWGANGRPAVWFNGNGKNGERV
jgi:hypothetical protein